MAYTNKIDNIIDDVLSIWYAKTSFMHAHISRKPTASKTILCYPEKPRHWYLLYPVLHVLGIRIIDDPHADFDVGMVFWDITKRPDDPTLAALCAQYPLINARCGDISKAHVGEVFREVFGYSLTIDPRTYKGVYVKKSDKNATHDGVIMHETSDSQKGFVYQRLVDNSCSEEEVRDMRVFIFKHDVPNVFYRYKTLDDRFDKTIRAETTSFVEVFTPEERTQILRFCDVFGLDYGELDILRDNTDGRIYIVDVSNTPSGPRRGVTLPAAAYDHFIATLAASFERAFLSGD